MELLDCSRYYDLIKGQHSSSDFRSLKKMCLLCTSGMQINVGCAGHMLQPRSGQRGSGYFHSITLFLDRHDPACIVLIGASGPSFDLWGRGKAGSRVRSHFSLSALPGPGWCPSGTDRAQDLAYEGFRMVKMGSYRARTLLLWLTRLISDGQ